jgi:hypothetical protein
MKTLDLFWMKQDMWAVIFDGEGHTADVVEGEFIPEQLHDGMCCCGKVYAECLEPGVAEILEQMKHSEEWRFDEGQRPFEFHHEFEIGGVTVVRIHSVKTGRAVIR